MGRVLAVAVALAVAATAVGARAQSSGEDVEQTAAARALFQQGMRAVDAQDWATAADLLGRSQALRSSPVVRYNLALALIELGHLVEASEHLRAARRESPEGSDAARLTSEQLALVEPRLGRLQIDVSGPRSTVEVRLDGEIVPDALVGVERPADPGTHRVSLHRGGQELASQELAVNSGRLSSVAFEAPPVPVTPEDAARSAVGTAAPVVTVEAAPVESQWWFWTLITVAALAIAGGIAGIVFATREPPPYIPGDSGAVHPLLLELP